jgi:ankyrin repeat protein
MSDAVPLLPRPNLEQYKKLAKDIQHACKSDDPGAIRNWAANWAEKIVRLQGMELTLEVRRQIGLDAERIEKHWEKFHKTKEQCKLTDAQLFIAREHGFASWPKFAKHVEALTHADSLISNFEAAADAIISGDVKALKKLLRDDPELVRARSAREHRSTLLHYVSANGVEDFRQKTPKNIVEIATLLLDAGADVNAESDAYGGGSTALGLVATSVHPERAGVQDDLMRLLLKRRAAIDGPTGTSGGNIVNRSLANGHGMAAEYLAKRGAPIDMEGAAGVGRLDVVKNYFSDDGTLKPPATRKQMEDGFAWASQFGRTSVVDFLLQRGMEVDAKLGHHGQTGLHWAAFGGHADTVKLLLQRGAAIDAKDKSYDGTPLDWTLYAWSDSPRAPYRYYEVVALLVRAGAKLDPQDREQGQQLLSKIKSDPRMMAALRGIIGE